MPVQPDNLPVRAILPELRATLAQQHRLLLQAPPGAGKTTLVPLDLLQADFLAGQKILLLEPRRLAARSVARRMAQMLGEEPGQTVGWRMQLDTRVSQQTRIEVVTEGVLTRMLQSDPSLEGTGLVIFDEFHERSLQADLGLTLALQTQMGYRDDENPLRLLVMSATLATEELVNLLDCPVIRSEGRAYPVTVHYQQNSRHSQPARNNSYELLNTGAATIRQALNNHSGSLLAFLPGTGEIRRLADMLQGTLPDNTAVHTLYGDLSPAAQDMAIQPAAKGQRKVVLATAIAESSLTIEGIHIVVDCGLMRVPRFDPNSGLSRLDTVRVSKASAEQRAGRAGRLAPGHCYRLWTEAQQQQLIAHTQPEINAADLAPLALELLAWGISDPNELDWLTPPPSATINQAFGLLESLGAARQTTDNRRQIARHGKEMARLGFHPRLAHMLLIAKKHNLEWLAAQLCVLLSERDPLAGNPDAGCDINLRLSLMAGDRVPGLNVPKPVISRIRQQSSRWLQRLGNPARRDYSSDDLALLLASAYPDRIARRRSHDGRYLLSNRQGVAFRQQEPLTAAEFLVIPAIGGQSHQREASVFLACEITLPILEELFLDQMEEQDVIRWDKQQKAVVVQQELRLGALVLESRPLKNPDNALIVQGLLQGIQSTGLHVLPWTSDTENFRQRVRCLHHYNHKWPDLSDESLLASVDKWLAPFIDGMSRLDHLKKLNLLQCLQAMLDWNDLQELDRQAPERIEVPSGSQIRIKYDNPAEPVLAVKLQELFGLLDTPMLAYGKLPLTVELLSPAQRPVQKTRDLRNFWASTYQDVKKDLKGRYPKHYWPEDPLTATATRFVRPR